MGLSHTILNRLASSLSSIRVPMPLSRFFAKKLVVSTAWMDGERVILFVQRLFDDIDVHLLCQHSHWHNIWSKHSIFLRSPLSHSSVFRHVSAPQSGKTTATQRHFLVWMTEFEPYSKFAFIIMKMNSKHFFLVGESPVKFLCVSLSLLFVFFDILLWMRAMRMARHFSNCCVSSLAFVCHFWQMNNREKWNCCDRDDDDNNETRYYNTKNN